MNVDFDLEGSRNEVARGTQSSDARPFMWRVLSYKAPRAPGRSCLLGSQLGTRRDDQVIGECCRDLRSSSEGVTGKPAHRAYNDIENSHNDGEEKLG